MIAVGIDIAKGKSKVCALNEKFELIWEPFDINHTTRDVEELIDGINGLDDEVRVVMESTGAYHRPLLISLKNAGFFVSLVNPFKIHKHSGSFDFRKVKTDSADAIDIADYGIGKWNLLEDYIEDSKVYKELKELNRSYQHYIDLRVNQINYLDKEIDKKHPGLKKLIKHGSGDFTKDKLLDFVEKWPHCEDIIAVSEDQFIQDYQSWAKEKGYHPTADKAVAIYQNAQESIPTISSSSPNAENCILEAIRLLRAINETLNSILTQMEEKATGLEEYEVAKEFSGISNKLALQITAEFGDLSKFLNKKCLIAYVGIDSPPRESGQYKAVSRGITKRGNSILRKVLYVSIICMKTVKDPENEVYQYVVKKENEGKAKKVANIAGMNKFLRIYYARVMERKQLNQELKAA